MTTYFMSGLAPAFLLATAVGYALATVGMKATAEGHVAIGLSLAALGFGAALMFEVLLLRQSDLSVVYIAIVVAETILVLMVATALGEGLSLRQMFGAGLVLMGLTMVTV